ncbi:hypothetical protein L218DRAFT_925955 [Marasmius fiardii PR-910]|nr:hypothetical protein L218DRAFT_925955 [Marasmius fiardii PR-910]
MSLSAPTITILKSIGNDLVNLIVCLSVQTVMITVYSMLVMKTTYILLRLRARTQGKMGPLVMLAVVLLMYLTTVTCWVIGLVNMVAEVRITLVKDSDVDLDAKYNEAREFSARRLEAIDLLYGYLTCLGDGVIVWRVYAFWATSHLRHVIMIVPIALVLAGIACSMMLTYCIGHLGPGEIVLGAVLHPPFCRDIQTVSYAIPAATTAAATFLIIIKVWSLVKFSKENKIYDSRMSRKSRLENIVILLVESGIAYFLFFLAQVIQIAPDVRDAINRRPNLAFATNVFIYQTSSIVGMYPTVIICLVHANRSAMDTTLCTTTGGRDSSKAIGGSGRRAPISLGSFRAVVQDLSTSTTTGADLESRRDPEETFGLQALHASMPAGQDAIHGLEQKDLK